MSDRPLLRSAKAVREALVDEIVGEMAPNFSRLTAEEQQQLQDGDFSPIQHRMPEFIAYSQWLMSAPVRHIAKRWPGYQIKQRELDRFLKVLLPNTVTVKVEGELRMLPDGELQARVARSLGLPLEELKRVMPLPLTSGADPETAA